VASGAGRRLRVRLIPVVGVLLGVAASGAVVVAIADGWGRTRDAMADAAWGWLLLALALAATGMVTVAIGWRHAIAALGGTVSRGRATTWYFVGEIGKYLPGAVWPVLGRAELARRGGLPGPVAYGSVVLSLGTLYLAATLALVATAPTLVDQDEGLVAVACGAALVAGVVVLHPAVTGWLSRQVHRVSRGRWALPSPPWGTALGLTLRYLPGWVFIGSATWAVARALDPDAGLASVWSAAVVSWVAGFVAVPVPGGVGVREAVFVALTPGLASGVAASVAVTARLAFILVDALGAVVGAAVLRSIRPPATAARGDEDRPPPRK
jgi:uncharacterized membrane protein YbhN (UPF0104 family)